MNNKLKKVLKFSWIGYAIFYFLRVNFSIALPGIMEEYGLTKTALGGAASAFFLMYAIGQFINGQIADKLGAKKLATIGLIGTILISLFIPQFAAVAGVLTIIWGLNGVFQSMGWSPTVKIVSSWTPDKLKGRVAGILGTSYIFGGALSWLFAGYVAKFGWRYVFYAPAILAMPVLIIWLFKVRENPEGKENKVNLRETFVNVLKDKRVIFAGIALLGLNIVRYGFLGWAPTYFFETQGANITKATYKALIFPMAGALGSLTIGWLTDKLFKNRKMLVGLIMTIILAISAIIFANTTSWILGLTLLAIIGFTTFGPHSLLVTQLPMIFGNRKNTASITGVINSLGYLGATITGIVSGFLIDNFSWTHAFYFWVLGAIISGVFIYLSQKNECA